jgi:3-dehydroquinate synthase
MKSTASRKQTSEIRFLTKWPRLQSFGGPCLLIYDSYFEKSGEESLREVKKWIETFPFRIGFESGEGLKDLREFPARLEKILEIHSQIKAPGVQIVGLGGGSIGDFAGFVASILKRGLPLVHIPTTWLSAMDSAHGGKTALNVGGFKNQIGTFYAARKILLVKPILLAQPAARAEEAFGEAVKMALLTGGKLWEQFSKIKSFENETAWKFLPQLIEGKYRIVKRDPLEKKGIRHLLNLGHTLGHVWEAALGLAHGRAVAYGIRASIELSKDQGVLTKSQYEKLQTFPVMQLLPSKADLVQIIQREKIDVRDFLLKDKKMSKQGALRFIFIQRPGLCPIRDVKIEELVQFCQKLAAGPEDTSRVV